MGGLPAHCVVSRAEILFPVQNIRFLYGKKAVAFIGHRLDRISFFFQFVDIFPRLCGRRRASHGSDGDKPVSRSAGAVFLFSVQWAVLYWMPFCTDTVLYCLFSGKSSRQHSLNGVHAVFRLLEDSRLRSFKRPSASVTSQLTHAKLSHGSHVRLTSRGHGRREGSA